MDTSAIPCRLCSGGSATPLERHEPSGATLYGCASCGGQFFWPVSNPGAEWYESTYSGRNADPNYSIAWVHRRFLADVPARGSLLDVGCGVGNFMAAARAAGWQVAGLDFDADGIRVAREHYGLNDLAQQSVAEFAAANPSRRFDAITAFEVLEHMDDPRGFIVDVARLLQPGGVICFSVPNRDSSAWLRPHDFPPRHLTRWSCGAMGSFLRSAGFTDIRCRTRGFPLIRIMMRLKFASKLGATGMVARAARSAGSAAAPASARRIVLLRTAARAKDVALFGIPTLAVWLWLKLSGGLRGQLYVTARYAAADRS